MSTPTSSSSDRAPGAQAAALNRPAESVLPPLYKPAEHEPAVRARWESSGVFHPDPQRVISGEAKPFAMFIPPPNVTAQLHLGHALNNTLQDILARVHRMRGYETLWMPGTDHAGIATQAVVEKRLRQEGQLKGPLKDPERNGGWTRDKFIEKVQAWKDEYEAVITGQLKAMGCSCDWDRQRFTMDEQCAKAVYEAFFRLFKDGLIYRGKRLVNWDPVLQTAVSDDECYDEEIDGQFYYLRYPLVTPATLPDGERIDHITVATTRPETYLGDTAVAMNPRDPRVSALAGLKLRLPFVGREIPIVVDDYVVLPEALATTEDEKSDPKAKFATGFLKVTPAHDANDYELGQRHKLPMINIFAPDASISDKHGWNDIGEAREFVGLKREAARKKIVEAFKAAGLLEAAKPYRHSVPHSDRSKAIIEPYLSDQWYVKVTDPRLAKSANEALHKGEVTFHPARYAKTYEQWHDNIRDWCISRQLWWGHRIPVWSKTDWTREDEATFITLMEAPTLAGDAAWEGTSGTTRVCPRDPGDRTMIDALERLGFTRDPDVLDTWFSSALWPLSTLGWPDPSISPANKGLLEAFNPSSVLSTAREIITLWVSRMVMFNRYLYGQGQGAGPVPFRDVFIHAIVQDGEGKKMSKSAGNGVDPLDIIATHGSDAMRFTLCQMATQTQDVRMPVVKDQATGKNTSPKFDLGRNLCNKLWNACRFALGMIADKPVSAPASPELDPASLSLIDRWMLSRLALAVREADATIANYEFANYGQLIYDLLWRDFCDWYLEGIKPTMAGDARQQAVLATVLRTVLKLMHPITPFVTETLWQHVRDLPQAGVRGVSGHESHRPAYDGQLCVSAWPKIDVAVIDDAAVASFGEVQSLVTAIREARASQQVKPSRKITLHLPQALQTRLADRAALVQSLANIESIITQPPAGSERSASFLFMGESECRISNLADAVAAGADADAANTAERTRLEKAVAEAEKAVKTLEGRLANPGYVDRAPPAMVQQTRDQLAKASGELAAARAALAKTGGGPP